MGQFLLLLALSVPHEKTLLMGIVRVVCVLLNVGVISCSNTMNDIHVTEKRDKHMGADLLLGLFFTFVFLMIMYHCYLRQRDGRDPEDDTNKQNNLCNFVWEREEEENDRGRRCCPC